MRYCNLIFFFFFQAEDGIRDPLVTGVQTCALPIFALGSSSSPGSLSTSLRYLRRTRLKFERSIPALRAAAEMLLSQARMSASTYVFSKRRSACSLAAA